MLLVCLLNFTPPYAVILTVYSRIVVCHRMADRHGWYCFRGRPTATRPDCFKYARLRNLGLAWYPAVNRYRAVFYLRKYHSG